jgi:hypothetical protein
MPPKKHYSVDRPTVASAIRASTIDEKRRIDKVEKEKAQSGSVHVNTTLMKKDLKYENNHALHREKFDDEKNEWTDKDTNETVSRTVTKTGKNVTASTQTPSTQRVNTYIRCILFPPP